MAPSGVRPDESSAYVEEHALSDQDSLVREVEEICDDVMLGSSVVTWCVRRGRSRGSDVVRVRKARAMFEQADHGDGYAEPRPS